MFIVWQGYGPLAAVIPPIVGTASQMLVSHFTGNYDAWDDNVSTSSAVGFFLGGIAVWYLGRWLNNRPGKILIDPQTNEKTELKTPHTLYWVRMESWGIVWTVLSGMAVLAWLFKHL
jgi:membrane protein YqaA with SNARE-associated domain